MIGLLAYLPFLIVALVVQWDDRDRRARYAAYVLFMLVDGVALMVGGAALLVAFAGRHIEVPDLLFVGANWATFGWVVLVTVVISPLMLARRVRQWCARWIPIDPDSAIHAIALALAILTTGLNLSQLPLIGGLEAIASSEMQVAFSDLLLTNLPIGVFAFVGVGLGVRRSASEVWERLGVRALTWRQVLLVVGLTIVILACYYGVDKVWHAVAPDNYEMMESLGAVLYGGAIGVWQGIALSLTAGFTEELLFRGALQPRLGYLLTAVFFTLVHVQYGLTPAALEVFVAALILGWLRRRSGTGACILLHTLYNAASFILFPLLP